MKVKFQGGPANGKYQELDDKTYGYSERLEYQAFDESSMAKFDRSDMWPSATVKIKRGSYARSNKSLKNGATIYIWMGWYER